MSKCTYWAARCASPKSPNVSRVVVIYSRRYRDAKGRIVQDQIELAADQSAAFYQAYPYFLWGTFVRRAQSQRWPVQGERPPLENMCRARRTTAFADRTGLAPVVWRERTYARFEPSLVGVDTDHSSLWRSESGTCFLMIEPYRYRHVIELREVLGQNLAVVEVPLSLSPYCGAWSPVAGALPGSRTFLIAQRPDEAELLGVLGKLENAADGALAWNDTTGVRCVDASAPTTLQGRTSNCRRVGGQK